MLHCSIKAKPKPEQWTKKLMDIALSKAGISMEDIEYCIGLGYDRKQNPFVKYALEDKPIAGIVKGLHVAIIQRIAVLERTIGIEGNVAMDRR